MEVMSRLFALGGKKCFKQFFYHFLFTCTLLFFGNSITGTCSPTTFPDNFLLGFATASYQIEGGWNADGKGENIWDHLTHTHPEWIKGRTNADVAADSYHKYKEDVRLLKHLQAQVYRFSLSWSRILPTGDIDIINQHGIDYYNNLIDELIQNGIQPMVTLYHWDLPQPLQELGGWTNPILADYYEEYARIAFKQFGDRVKLWLTFNEPLQSTIYGYGSTLLAPSLNMSGIADYLAGHTLIISHARAYRLYEKEFKEQQQGRVGITLDGCWNEPASNSTDNMEAAETQMQFEFGWFGHPILKGDYPAILRKRVDANSRVEGRRRSRLPVFDSEMINYIHGTADFLGLNHYTTHLVTPASQPTISRPSWDRDTGNNVSQDSSWPGSAATWLKVVPWGFRKLFNWIKNEYDNIPVIVTENGFADNGTLLDYGRIYYHKQYIGEMLKAIYYDGCNVEGYIAWSLMDNFEWRDGYETMFGVYSVNFNSENRTRTGKLSSKFFREMYGTRMLPSEVDQEGLMESTTPEVDPSAEESVESYDLL